MKLSTLRNKADRQAKQWVFNNLSEFCEVCGQPATTAHHFFRKNNFGHLRYCKLNLIPICNFCHYKHHSLANPTIHAKIIKHRGIKWYDILEKLAREKPKSSYINKGYYEKAIKDFET